MYAKLCVVHIHSVCLFVVLFIYMDSGLLDPNYLILILVCIVLVCYASRSIIEKKGKYKGRDIQTMLIFLTLAFGLSPVLQTLTETISTDTIYAMTVFMLLSNVLFHNYRVNEPISRSLSLNASVFASVCLASRFNSRMHAFATVTLALLIFALWPEIRKTLEVHVRGAAPIMTLSSITTALIALYSVSSMAALLFSLVIITFTFLIPLWLIRLQPSKNNIHGPWDEAVIQ
ncbi:phosphatidylinositol N-acetylglucosaminyltransferase subunit C-like isoform X2 [Antedon mediterranea]|uniref:phosphatidylinositol N-acetylglucosaminyltransferase subunit C-like isoform X2 n=1 Tax=Antedon mediterranea TaxID=105859 RepID=UPI003AF6D705